jgi:hypothetical protein
MKHIRLLPLSIVLCALLFSLGCPSYWRYNIVGSWMVDAFVEGELKTASLTFVGDKESGTCTMTAEGEFYSGTYSVSKDVVDFSLDSQGMTVITFEGTFEDRDKMSGSGVSDWGSGTDPFIWSAVRRD